MVRLSRKYILPALILAAALQTAAIGKMVIDRNQLLVGGQEVLLETRMIDPRDIFRGHFVRLNLAISRVSKSSVDMVGSPEYHEPIWAELTPSKDGAFWQVSRLYADMPDAPNSPLIKGRFVSDYGDTYQLRFPVDRYFAAKQKAQELEDLDAEGRMGVILSLSPEGNAAIKGITVDGQPLYVEPLY